MLLSQAVCRVPDDNDCSFAIVLGLQWPSGVLRLSSLSMYQHVAKRTPTKTLSSQEVPGYAVAGGVKNRTGHSIEQINTRQKSIRTACYSSRTKHKQSRNCNGTENHIGVNHSLSNA